MPKGVPNKRYTGEFKQMVVETMLREKISYKEAARRFDVSCHTRVKIRFPLSYSGTITLHSCAGILCKKFLSPLTTEKLYS